MACTPKEEFKFREEEVPNGPPARMPPALSWEFYLGKFESVSSRSGRRRDLAAFSTITVLVLVSLVIFYQDGMAEDVQSLLKSTFG